MKLKRSIRLRDEKILGHDVFVQVDPFVAQALVDVLKFQKFKIDPQAIRMTKVFFAFYGFGYRIRSRKMGLEVNGDTINWSTVYHEGLHNIIGLRFGTKLIGRPMMTLLNECLGLPLPLYFMASLAQASGFIHRNTSFMQTIIRDSKRLGLPFEKNFRKAMGDPFKAYKGAVLEVFSVHKRLFDILKASKIDGEKKLRALTKELKGSENVFFYSHSTPVVPVLFVTGNCGMNSIRADIRAVHECLEILHASKTFEDFFKNLGVSKILAELEKSDSSSKKAA